MVAVEWLDATGPMDLYPDDDLDVADTVTVGRVRYTDERRVVLAPEWFSDPMMYERACTAIPTMCILNVRILIPHEEC